LPSGPLANGYLHRSRLLIGDSPLPVSLVFAQIVNVRHRDRCQPPVPLIAVLMKLSVQNLLCRWAAEPFRVPRLPYPATLCRPPCSVWQTGSVGNFAPAPGRLPGTARSTSSPGLGSTPSWLRCIVVADLLSRAFVSNILDNKASASPIHTSPAVVPPRTAPSGWLAKMLGSVPSSVSLCPPR